MPTNWPDWWDWEIEATPHLLKRMMDRGFNETDLRLMLDAATEYRPSAASGRFVITCPLDARLWEVVVEPDEPSRSLLIITAYPKATL